MGLVRLKISASFILGLVFAAPVKAADYPDHQVTIIVPFAPGGGIDGLARILASELQTSTGKPFVIENIAGANGDIGTRRVATAKPDGYTLLATNDGLTTNVAMRRETFDLSKLSPVAALYSTPLAVAVNPNLPVKTFPELITFLRQSKTPQAYSSCGAGSSQHITAELVKLVAKVKMDHVAYKGCGPAIVDGVGGHVSILFNTVPNVLPQALEGKLRLLAVSSPIGVQIDGKPVAVLDQLPGFETVKARVWTGLFAPPNLPDNVAVQIEELVNRAKTSERVKAYTRTVSMSDMGMAQSSFRDFLKEDAARLLQTVTSADLKPD